MCLYLTLESLTYSPSSGKTILILFDYLAFNTLHIH